jgi:hypothetical protein
LNRTIEITISPRGETKIETQGFAGSSCQEATRLLEQALGRVTNEQLTPEFHDMVQTKNHEQQRE